MPISDKKKVQTMINIVAQQASIVREAVQVMKDVRTTFQSVNPDVTGTPLEGTTTAVSNAINALDTEIGGAVWDGLIAAEVPTHRNKALD